MVKNADMILEEYLNTHEDEKRMAKNFKLKNDPRVTKIGKIIRKQVLMNYRNYGMY